MLLGLDLDKAVKEHVDSTRKIEGVINKGGFRIEKKRGLSGKFC